MSTKNVGSGIVAHSVTKAAAVLLGLALLLPLPKVGRAQQATPSAPQADPVARGALIYAGNCERCHGAYADERVGRRVAPGDLKAKIAGTTSARCRVRWARSQGGPLAASELDALVAYIVTWEQASRPPNLPPLPSQPGPTPDGTDQATDFLPAAAAASTPASTPAPTPAPTQDAALLAILDESPVYRGAWVYTENCLRCHNDYAIARMGMGMPEEKLHDTIVTGKAGTSMPAFGVLRGGSLRSRDVSAVVAYIQAWERLGTAPVLPALLASRIKAAPAPIGTPPAVVLKSSAVLSETTRSAPGLAPAALVPGRSVADALQTSEATSAENLRLLWLYCMCMTPFFVLLSVLLGGGILLIRRARETAST